MLASQDLYSFLRQATPHPAHLYNYSKQQRKKTSSCALMRALRLAHGHVHRTLTPPACLMPRPEGQAAAPLANWQALALHYRHRRCLKRP